MKHSCPCILEAPQHTQNSIRMCMYQSCKAMVPNSHSGLSQTPQQHHFPLLLLCTHLHYIAQPTAPLSQLSSPMCSLAHPIGPCQNPASLTSLYLFLLFSEAPCHNLLLSVLVCASQHSHMHAMHAPEHSHMHCSVLYCALGSCSPHYAPTLSCLTQLVEGENWLSMMGQQREAQNRVSQYNAGGLLGMDFFTV